MPPSSSAWSATHCTRRPAVIERGGEAVLGSVPVVHRHDERVAAHAQVPAQRIVGVGVAENPAAAVEVDDDGMRTRARRSIQAVGQGPRSAGQGSVDDLADVGARRAAEFISLMKARACSARHRLQRRQVQRCHLLEDHLDVGLQPAHHAVVALRTATPGQPESQVVAGHHLVARRPVEVDARRRRP